VIEFYGGGSPNALKITIMLEELGLAYKLTNIKSYRQESYTPEFLKLNPLGKYPVIIDSDGPAPGHPIFESGAILIYLAETYGREFLPESGMEHWETLQWLFVQTSWVGPMLGQNTHFRVQPSEVETYAAIRYRDQGRHIFQVLNKRLSETPWLAADRYTIADIATFPWANVLHIQGYDWADYPSIRVWCDRIAGRPGVVRAMAVTSDVYREAIEEGAPRTEEDVNRHFNRTSGPKIDYSPMGIPIKSPT
jgi:GST-like protein